METWKFREERPEDAEIRKIGDASQATAAGGAADFGHHDHQVVIQDMIHAINDDRDVIIPVTSVRPTVELALALYQSAARNAPFRATVTISFRASTRTSRTPFPRPTVPSRTRCASSFNPSAVTTPAAASARR